MDFNERFFQLYDALKEQKHISTYVQLAEILGTNKAGINDLKNGRKKITLDNIISLKKSYPSINIEWIITGKGEKFIQEDDKISLPKTNIEAIQLFDTTIGTVRTTDVPIVDISAAAGFGFLNNDYVEQLGMIQFPANMIKSGLNYCVRNKGFSMSPTLNDSDYVIVRHLQPNEWLDMPDEHIYLVVDKDGLAYMKRIKNRLNKGFIVCMSDSIDKANYPNFNKQIDEIANIFHAEWHLSAKMQNINETYYSRLKMLEDRIDEMDNEFMKIKKLKE